MAISVKIAIKCNGSKISAICEWRAVMLGHATAASLTESKNFVEAIEGKGVEVLLTETQFARFVVASYGPCDGCVEYRHGYDSTKPLFVFYDPKTVDESFTYDFTK